MKVMHHRQIRILACFLWISLACNTLLPGPATPAPIPTVVDALEIPNATIEYYDVSGSSEWELRKNLNTLSPVDENGYRGDALTSWVIHWDWDGYGTETCDLASAITSYDVAVRLPRWTPSQDAPPELITKWNAYMFALVEHEKGHVDRVVAYFPDVLKAIQGATCTTAEAMAQDVLSQLHRDDFSYDEETNHGGTQGAIFP